MKEQPKDLHYVPKCYLKEFISGTHLYKLDMLDVNKGYNVRPKPASPTQICYSEFYYLIKPEYSNAAFNLSELHEMYIEQDIFKVLEGRYHGLVSTICSNNKVSRADVEAFSDFMFQLKLRNPYWQNHTINKYSRTWINQAIEEILSEVQREKKYASLPPELQRMLADEFKKQIHETKDIEKQMQLNSLILRANPKNNRTIRKTVVNLAWEVLTAPESGPYFITSDNPGIAIGKDGKYDNMKFTDGATFYLPLTYRHSLRISDTRKDDFYNSGESTKKLFHTNIRDTEVLKINFAAIQMINKLIIGSDDVFLQLVIDAHKEKAGN